MLAPGVKSPVECRLPEPYRPTMKFGLIRQPRPSWTSPPAELSSVRLRWPAPMSPTPCAYPPPRVISNALSAGRAAGPAAVISCAYSGVAISAAAIAIILLFIFLLLGFGFCRIGSAPLQAAGQRGPRETAAARRPLREFPASVVRAPDRSASRASESRLRNRKDCGVRADRPGHLDRPGPRAGQRRRPAAARSSDPARCRRSCRRRADFARGGARRFSTRAARHRSALVPARPLAGSQHPLLPLPHLARTRFVRAAHRGPLLPLP